MRPTPDSPRTPTRVISRGRWPQLHPRGRPGARAAVGVPGRGRVVVLGTVALIGLIAGSMLVAHRLRESPSDASSATLAGLRTSLHTAGWAAMDAHTMDQAGGFAMPAQMMPGAPEGDLMRLGVPVTLTNTSDEAQRFVPVEEFTLVDQTQGTSVTLHSDTFGQLSRLNPGSAVNGVLYFDTVVPAAGGPPLRLRWTRGGQSVSLPVSMSTDTPAEHHGP